MVSKDKFHRFVRLQMGGTVNMYDVPYVTAMALISEDEYKEIRDNYGDLEAEYGLPSKELS